MELTVSCCAERALASADWRAVHRSFTAVRRHPVAAAAMLREIVRMLDLDLAEMKRSHRSAVLSAELLRQSGDVDRAARVESLARILERRLARAAADGSVRGESKSGRSGNS